MSEGEGPSAGAILIGIFLILFGLCLVLVGGGCTIGWTMYIFTQGDFGGAGLLLISLAALAAGVVVLWAGVKMFRSS